MKLIDILSTFKGCSSDENDLTRQFAEMAKMLLYGGHFRVMGTKNIYLEEIEFYYHEENGTVKDPIMYHTNEHEGKDVPYFILGRFNLHQSGVDVTFENEEKAYRASFLIRAFSVDGGKVDNRSTYIYDEMFYMGVPMAEPIEIEWVEDEIVESIQKSELEGTWRINVAEYEKNEEGKYIKKVATDADKDTFKYNKVTYVKCPRKWRFIKKTLIENYVGT